MSSYGTRITSKFRLPSRGPYIRSHGYPFRAEGGAGDATEPAGVRGGPAGALSGGDACRERHPPKRGRHRHRPAPQGGDPPAAPPAAGADGALARGAATGLRVGGGPGARGPLAGHRGHRAAAAPSLRAPAPRSAPPPPQPPPRPPT